MCIRRFPVKCVARTALIIIRVEHWRPMSSYTVTALYLQNFSFLHTFPYIPLRIYLFLLSLHFVPSLQSAVCILYLVCILYPVCGLQSAVCSLHFVLTEWLKGQTKQASRSCICSVGMVPSVYLKHGENEKEARSRFRSQSPNLSIYSIRFG